MNTTFSPIAHPKDFLRGIAFDLPGRFPIARWAPIPLRLIVGLGFIEHGLAKLSKGPDAFAAILHALAVPAPHFMAWVTVVTELLGGFALSCCRRVDQQLKQHLPSTQQRCSIRSSGFGCWKSGYNSGAPSRRPRPTHLYKTLLTFYSFTGQGELTISICLRHAYFRRTGGRVVARSWLQGNKGYG